MPKTLTTPMLTHLQQDLTTLVTCWSIRRRDGIQLYFTDHVRDLTIAGNRYRADIGYERTAIKNTLDFKVDNLDISGIFDDAAITVDEVRSGLYDGADVEFFLVNYEDLSMGSIPLRKGVLGEVAANKSGRFTAELRSLGFKFKNEIGESYSPTCRADLGDSRCKIPIKVQSRRPNTFYNKGEFFKTWNTGTRPLVTDMPILNRSFNTAITNWTQFEGSAFSTPAQGGLTPNGGTDFVYGATQDWGIYQDVAIPSGTVPTADIDNEYCYINSVIKIGSSTDDSGDKGRYRIDAMDVNGDLIREIYSSGWVSPTSSNWARLFANFIPLPIGTRTIRYWIQAKGRNNNPCTIGFDELYSTVVNNQVKGTSVKTGDIMYEVTASGLSENDYFPNGFPTTPGQTYTDGAATIVALESYARSFTVTNVTSRKVLTISVNDTRAQADGWFDRGVMTFETGNNQLISREVKSWVSPNEVELFDPMPKDITIGDVGLIYPGCDKTRTSCRTKFALANSLALLRGNVINMRAEPDLPGRDEVGGFETPGCADVPTVDPNYTPEEYADLIDYYGDVQDELWDENIGNLG